MRLLLIVLVLLTAAIQYPLWWGKGGWLRVHELRKQITEQHETNAALTARNNALAAEVQDLKSGTQAVEERARAELGLIRQGEVFVQLLAPNEARPHTPASSSSSSSSSSRQAAPASRPGSSQAAPRSSTPQSRSAPQVAPRSSSPAASQPRTGSQGGLGSATQAAPGGRGAGQ